jgi:glycosyltransferase involved in cell wall biosynthesis
MAEYSKADMFKTLTSTAGRTPSDILGDNAFSSAALTSGSDEADFSQSKALESKPRPLVYCIAMIRNEADIITNFLDQALLLFHKTFIVDIQSSDGTREIVDAAAKKSNDRIVVFNCLTQERYQSALMNTLSRKAFSEGADWIFLLDADEFIDVKNQKELCDFLSTCQDDLIHLPWINLIPSEYGDFQVFHAGQEYSFSDQPSRVSKVAVSARYALINPDFCIEEGNHNVSKKLDGSPERQRLAFPILHLPVRSAARLKYKMINGARLLDSKHNTRADEGHHAATILRRLEENEVTPALLDSIALTYALRNEVAKDSLPTRGAKNFSEATPSFGRRRLPFFARDEQRPLAEVRPLKGTLERDAELQWEHVRFAHGVPVCAELRDSDLRIRCLPKEGRGHAFYGRYSALGPDDSHSPSGLNVNVLTHAIAGAFTDVDWSGLAPVLFALFSLLRPRRYVELGVETGKRFFAVCQASERLKLKTQCIGVDAWIEDPADSTFNSFRTQLESRFPAQHFIRGSFSDALDCFDDGSVDLLLIDGCHHYGVVMEDFESWMPKMSSKGTMIFHNINAYGRDFGVRRLWSELKRRYPAYSFYHGGGLGILYVGHRNNVIFMSINSLSSNGEYAALARLFFEQLGELASSPSAAIRKRIDTNQGGDTGENIDRWKVFLNSAQFNRNLRTVLRGSLFKNRIKYWLCYLSGKRRERYTKKKREVKDAIAYIDWNLRLLRPELHAKQRRSFVHNFSRTRGDSSSEPVERVDESVFVRFDKRYAERHTTKGLHPKVRLIIPTRGCSKWLPYFLKAYRSWGLKPTYAVDNGCEPETLRLLKESNVNMIFIDADHIPNGESIMPYLSKSIPEDYVLRLDDDEFLARELIEWVNSIPDSKYAFVTSWWIPRYEVALLDGALWSCHPKWMRTKVGDSLYENLQGGRFYRHKDVTYDKVGPHHGNFTSHYVSHAPSKALIIHLDCLVRTMEERLNKIRSTEKRFKDAGWPFANHMLPEMAPRELLGLKDFDNPDLAPLINELLEKVYRPTEKLTLGVDELIAIQQDRLSHDTMHFHY